ncbi:MAG: DUF805 domain-containing protein [Thermodesulfobacteriota bacterium]
MDIDKIKNVWTTTDGRIGRRTYWVEGILPLLILLLIVYAIDSILGAGGLLATAAQVAALYPSVSIGIKRFHDRDKSGWWVLISLIPVIGSLWYLIECGFLKGTDDDNKYGGDPLRA